MLLSIIGFQEDRAMDCRVGAEFRLRQGLQSECRRGFFSLFFKHISNLTPNFIFLNLIFLIMLTYTTRHMYSDAPCMVVWQSRWHGNWQSDMAESIAPQILARQFRVVLHGGGACSGAKVAGWLLLSTGSKVAASGRCPALVLAGVGHACQWESACMLLGLALASTIPPLRALTMQILS